MTVGPNLPDGAIAIVGIAGRFPGADSISAFWKAVCEGRDLIQPHAPAMLADNFTDAERARDNYVPVRPAIADADMFDAAFWGMLPREAAQTDPQFRVFLECCWQAFEDAGHDPARPPGPVGVFGGASMSTYFLNSVLADRGAVENFVSTYQLGDYQQFMGALGDTLATRVAFRMGLTGPAMTVATACSTSLVAVAQACQSLDAFQCDMALAGGVSITFPQERGYFYQEGGMVSRDGHCRPFDAGATGTVFGHGAGAVALRRAEDAVADGDRIHALIRGVGLNNDGNDKISFTAPSVTGQAMAIAQAQGAAGVDADSITYVECHGTGTPLGDPVEFEGLKRAFAGVVPGQVAIGSVKANIGHCDAAAGVIGLIKTALMLRHRAIPPMANYTAPNPAMALDGSAFRIPTAATEWRSDGPLRAGVSAMGVGGTNAHVILEEAPACHREGTEGTFVLPLSARSETALAASAAALADALEGPDAPSLADAAFTLQAGRRQFDHRHAFVAANRLQAVAALRTPFRASRAGREAAPVVFMFPGQGAQYPGMGRGLYETEPGFARILDQGFTFLEPLLGFDLGPVLYCDDNADAAARILRDTAITQPALFLVEYATAKIWQDRGITPTAMIGHSVGEFVAATLAGVMSFETGLSLIAARGRLMQDQPPGAMLSVRAAPDDLGALVPGDVDLAARNAPKLCVYAGPEDSVSTFAARLDAADITSKRLNTLHAFHSAMMDPVAEALEMEVATHVLEVPRIPYVSCVTGTWITDEQATDPGYWANHCRATVNFDAGIRTLCAGVGGAPMLVEVGPGRTLGSLAAQAVPREDRSGIVSSLPDHTETGRDLDTMTASIGALWSAGVGIDWTLVNPGSAMRCSLPGYPFERQRHWIAPPLPISRQSPTNTQAVPEVIETRADMQTPSRTLTLTSRLFDVLADLSGDTFSANDATSSFLELGFDSLLLGQVTQRLAREMGVSVTFRQLMTEFPSVSALAAHLDAVLPPEVASAAVAEALPAAKPLSISVAGGATRSVQLPNGADSDKSALMQMQTQAMLALFEGQLRLLGGDSSVGVAAVPSFVPTPVQKPAGRAPVAPGADKGEVAERHDLNRRAAGQAEFTAEQRQFIKSLCDEYSAKFPTSKARAQDGRRILADPRTAAGFRPEWKQLVFPIIAEASKGSTLTDPDGNVFVDLVNGFGQTAFGHAPDFVTQAVAAQMQKGFAIGPQTPLAREAAEKFLALTGHERVTFCNTGSEAVMAAIRLARTVTGRDTVVCFKGDYHGQFDEVLVKGRASGDPTALPAVAGVPATSVSNMVVLGYGTDEALAWIADNIAEVAAVLIEPVQSRHPELRPRAFCEEVRRITAANGAALIMDEIVTGFRVAPGGMQELWGIKADMATWGKVAGGGMPLGVLSGTARFLDALDGGFWSFGDDSVPEVPPTFFAGTFVRHPLVLAALSAVLDHIVGEGRALYDRVAPRTGALLERMNDILVERGLPPAVTGFSSWMIVNLSTVDPRAALMYPLMRLGGVHVHDGYPWFLTTAHSEDDFIRVEDVFAGVIDRLQSVGILAPKVANGSQMSKPEAVAAVVPSDVPLTEPQKEIWMAAQLGDAASGVFTESISLTMDGPLDTVALEHALNGVIARHDALRMRFAPNGKTARVMPHVDMSLAVEDMDDDDLAKRIAADAKTPFDLVAGPPVRAALARLSPVRHVLILTAHHIICDGWSSYLILQELAALYNAAGGDARLAPAASFAAYAVAQENKEPGEKTVKFWTDDFPMAPVLPDLPFDNRRQARRSFEGATHVHRIDRQLAGKLKRAAAKEGVTLFSALAGTLALLLARISNSTDIVFAVPTAGQTLLPDDRMVGHLVNLLPIRINCDMDLPVRDHLRAAASRVLDCFEHGDTTYGAILRAAGLSGSVDRQPLTEVQFNLDQQPDDFGFAGLTTAMAGNARAYTNFDLIFNITESVEGLRIDLTYATDVIAAETAARWCRHYHCLLASVAEDMDQTTGTVPMLSVDERMNLIAMGGTTDPATAPNRIDAMIAARIAATPDAIAIEDAAGAHSYADLGQRVDRLSAVIAQRLPEPGKRVAVLLPRSVGLVAALLAVMRAGHAYVPLDFAHPPARLRAVLEAANVSGLIALSDVAELAQGLDLVCIDTVTDIGADADHTGVPSLLTDTDATAYVIFTSGSTGTPKGVEVPHAALANLVSSMASRPGLTSDDVLLSVTTVSFDIAALEFFGPLSVGGRCVIATETEVREAFPLVEQMKRVGITVMQATPTLWQMLLEAGLSKRPIKALVGGEPLPRDLADRLLMTGAEVWNMYGPTETTIWSSCGQVGKEAVTIGTPVAGTVLHVLDASDRIAPPGCTGELNIGGTGLAKGYLGRPDLTDAAFRIVDLDGVGPVRLYRSGDLARRNADGTITLLGRRDGQIKLRGFRIEIGDIEATMRGVPGVTGAAVDLRESPAGQMLVGFYTGAERSDLGSSLARLLPAYMVPTRFQHLDALPKTANGKLDRRALPPLGPLVPASVREVVAPETGTESALLSIWKEVLGNEAIGITDDLFALGADSLSVFRIAARALDQGLGIEAKHLIRHPTIRDVAAFAATQSQRSAAPSLRDFRRSRQLDGAPQVAERAEMGAGA